MEKPSGELSDWDRYARKCGIYRVKVLCFYEHQGQKDWQNFVTFESDSKGTALEKLLKYAKNMDGFLQVRGNPPPSDEKEEL